MLVNVSGIIYSLRSFGNQENQDIIQIQSAVSKCIDMKQW